jgi:hypothetical protein
MNENELSALVRLEAEKQGMRLWRNNVGATYTKEGNFIRYGLANDSKQLNSVVKSADLIGVKPIRITSEMIGKVIGQFVSYEIKNPHWVYRGTPHEMSQHRWLELIKMLGGDARFITKLEDLL